MGNVVAALSVTVSVATSTPVAEGSNETVIVQLAPAASDVPQVFVWLKVLALAPPMAMLPMVSADAPGLLSVTVCIGAVPPNGVEKLSCSGESTACGPVAEAGGV